MPHMPMVSANIVNIRADLHRRGAAIAPHCVAKERAS